MTNDIEVEVREAWRQLLPASDPAKESNFFADGGNSVLAARMIARVARQTGARVLLKDFFKDPTLGHTVALARQSLETT